MQTPVDYPIIDDAHSSPCTIDELIHATQLDRVAAPVPPDIHDAMINAPMFSRNSPKRSKTSERFLQRPLTSIAQTLLTRDGNIFNRVSDRNGMFSRWNRVMR
ncbi:MAG: hypothetical protein AB8B87_13940 [Granulosicoccus sp.]